MKGVQAYDCSQFHGTCSGIQVVDIGGFPHLWCPTCRVLSNLQAVAPKFENFDKACLCQEVKE